jgi:hypothetical protein
VRRRRSSSTSNEHEEEAIGGKCKVAATDEQVEVCREDDACGWQREFSIYSIFDPLIFLMLVDVL